MPKLSATPCAFAALHMQSVGEPRRWLSGDAGRGIQIQPRCDVPVAVTQTTGFIARVLAAAAMLGSACGCASVSTQYTPHKAEYRSGAAPSTALAVVAYEGDVEALADAGGEIIGTIDADGNARADREDIEEAVCERAAALGATHVIFVAAHIETHQAPSTFRATCRAVPGLPQARCVTRERFGELTETPHAKYVLLRVPPTSWSKLPPSLQVSGSIVVAPSSERRPAVAPTPAHTDQAESWSGTSPVVMESPDATARRAQDIRRRCFDGANKAFSAAKLQESDAAAPPMASTASESSDAARFGDAYATMKAEDDVRRDATRATPRDEALAWYWKCVVRESTDAFRSTP